MLRLLTVLTTVALVLAGCGGGDGHGAGGTHQSVPVPTTHVPATHALPTNVPTTNVPTTNVPTTNVPTTNVPRTNVPATTVPPTTVPPTTVPRFAHIVIAVLENHSFDEVVGQPDAPFLNSLAARGAVLTRSYAVTHPSQPNYLAMFSGSTQGVTSDACPLNFAGGNLARSLLDAGRTFAGYAEDLPAVGYSGCSAAEYARKHSPWVDFTNVPASLNKPMFLFPTDGARLPTVSFVIPDLAHDMHDGTLAAADGWLKQHLGGYAAWAPSHDSLLIVTSDEDDGSAGNRIATLLVGDRVAPGRYADRVDHYGLLRTIEDAYGLPRLGNSAQATPITAVWTAS